MKTELNAVAKSDALEQLLDRQDLWRGGQEHYTEPGFNTGFKELNQRLTDGGWPKSGLCELIVEGVGIGELSLLTPLLSQLIPTVRASQAATTKIDDEGLVVMVAPPYIPLPSAFALQGVDIEKVLWIDTAERKEQLWALEQVLSSDACQLALCWLEQLSVTEARRLQLACEKGKSLCVCYLPESELREPHPVHLRMQLQRRSMSDTAADNFVTAINIVKRRGGWPVSEFELNLQPKYLQPDGHLTQAKPDVAQVVQGPWSG